MSTFQRLDDSRHSTGSPAKPGGRARLEAAPQKQVILGGPFPEDQALGFHAAAEGITGGEFESAFEAAKAL